MNEWLNHPALKNMDPVKLELIKLAAKQTEGKNGKSLAPVMMSLISSAHKKGITFSPEEMSFVLEILKDGKSKEEQAQIDRMVRMVSGYAKRAGIIIQECLGILAARCASCNCMTYFYCAPLQSCRRLYQLGN